MQRWRVVIGLVLAGMVVGCGDDDPHHATSRATPTPTVPPQRIVIDAPAADVPVDTLTFDVAFHLDGEFAADSIELRINDTAVPFRATPPHFVATLSPGAPLRDANRIRVTGRNLGGASIAAERDFAYLPPKARARRITATSDLITGPLAQNRIGDFLLENAVARFAVQDAPQRNLGNVGTYGGNLIDAELVGRPGRDNFLEVQPMVNVETVIHAEHAEIVNDGEDGTAAIIRSCGPDDILDFINPSSNFRDLLAIELPASIDDADYDVDGCTEYRLEAGVPYVEMFTTIHNHHDEDVGLFVGDFLAAGGQLDSWQSAKRRPNGMGEILVSTVGALSYIGFGEATGIDYGYIGIPNPGSQTPDDVLSVSGVQVVLHAQTIPSALFGSPPAFQVPAGGSRSYRRYFSVGDGSGSNTIDAMHTVTAVTTGMVRGCVVAGGQPLPQARVAIGPQANGAIVGLSTHFVTGDDGCYAGTLPPATYGAVAAHEGYPFEGSSPAPPVRTVRIEAGSTVVQDFELPEPARLQVTVLDERDQPLPARVMLVGFEPSPDPALRTAFLTGTTTTFLFRDRGDDALPFGIVSVHYTTADGRVAIDAKPGEYAVVVSRGPEYSMFQQRLTLDSASPANVTAQIARVIDTSGFVSSDFHVHGLNSTDSRVGNRDRVLQYAGEGFDNIVMTEHGGRTDLLPVIERLGLSEHVFATVGEEITSWEYGHFNGYPFDLDPAHPSGGAVDWARAAEPGRDFVAYGAYNLSPAELDAAARSGVGSRSSTVVQVNHIHGYYGPLQIDTSLVPPRSFISAADRIAWRIDPGVDNLFHHFAVLEVWNGSGRRHQDRFFGGDIGIWFNQLNQGLLTTATGVTDSHGFTNLGAAGARTWTAAPSDSPMQIDPDQVTDAVAAGRAVLGQGAYVQARLIAGDESGAMADFSLGGSTMVQSTNGSVHLDIDVQAPLWAPFDRIEVYANAPTTPSGQRKGTNVLFRATPRYVHDAGTDFEVERLPVFPQIPGAERLTAHHRIDITDLGEDTWFVVVVRGTDGVSRPMFPIMPDDLARTHNTTLDDLIDGNLGESGVLAMAVTNPLFADVDGVPGFQAPLAP